MDEKKDEKKRVGEILVEEGFLDEENVAYLLGVQKQRDEFITLGKLAVEFEYLDDEELTGILEKYRQRILIGEIFIELGLITPDQLQETLSLCKEKKARLGEMLIKQEIITDEDLVRALSQQLNIPRIIPDPYILESDELLEKVNERFIRMNNLLPAFKRDDILTVIMADPLDQESISNLEQVYKCKIEPAIAAKHEIENAIDFFYSDEKIEKKEMEASIGKDLIIDDEEGNGGGKGNRIVNVVNYIFLSAVIEGASDIHIEPQENKIQIRYRIDGILHVKTDLPITFISSLSTRIKVLCQLDIAERRKHQDGRIEAKVKGEDIDFRVSTYVSDYGENIVIRILKRRSTMVKLDKLGFTPKITKIYEAMLAHPSGVILVTGPTGSGKTTSLYASLKHINDNTKKIITVEDPIEYSISGIVQGKLHDKIGMGYPEFIKSMMRQDPDILMIGEIRDAESAAATINAALTGHKVFTTFHTEDSTGALIRLVDMGIDSYLISSTVLGVVAQRLVRLNCPNCLEAYQPMEGVIESFHIRDFDPKKWTFFKGKGCDSCGGKGYRGRTGIHEVLVINDHIRNAILNQCNISEVRAVAREKANLVSMQECGFYKAIKRETTLEEILRISYATESDECVTRSVEEIIELCEGDAYLDESIEEEKDKKLCA